MFNFFKKDENKKPEENNEIQSSDVKNEESEEVKQISQEEKKNIFSIGINDIKPEYRDMVSAVWNKMNIDKKIVPYKDKGIEIDIDGSFRNGKTSYAAIIRKDGKVIKNISGLMEVNEVKDSHQVAGELRAAMEAIKWCKENNIAEADIYYDMKGIENWATGKWKANKEITKEFKQNS